MLKSDDICNYEVNKMLMKYIFINKVNMKKRYKKNSSGKILLTELENPVHMIMKQIFDCIKHNVVTIEIDGEKVEFSYECTKMYEDRYYINLEVEHNLEKSAKILHEVYSRLTKGKHRKDFHIILSYDEASKYYCEKIFPKLGEFEIKVKTLMYSIMLEAFGIHWVERCVPDEIKKDIKKEINSRLVEEALQGVTLWQLEQILFEARPEIEPGKLIKEELSIDKIGNMQKEEIIELIDKGRPISLWEKYFAKAIKITNFEQSMLKLRKYRNKVAHHRLFTINDFEDCNQILETLIEELNLAIRDIEKGENTSIEEIGIMISKSLKAELKKLIAEYGESNLKQILEIEHDFKGRGMLQIAQIISKIHTEI